MPCPSLREEEASPLSGKRTLAGLLIPDRYRLPAETYKRLWGQREGLNLGRLPAQAGSALIAQAQIQTCHRSTTRLCLACDNPLTIQFSTRFSLRGPQRMCACRNSSTAASISGAVWLEWLPAARFISTSPSLPNSRYRRSHTYPVSRLIPKLAHSSLIVCSSRSYSKMKRSFSSITLLAFHGMPPFYTPPEKLPSVRNAPGPFCQLCSRSVPRSLPPPSPPCSPQNIESKGREKMMMHLTQYVSFETILPV